jgi:glycine/D-amino acid oxidase-like deaminating enzyme
VLATTSQTFPAFAKARVRERWAGALVSTLDNMPVISAVRSHPGLWFGTGFYYGLTMGPAAGEALADLVTGARPKIDLSLYRYERFIDGSEPVFRA